LFVGRPLLETVGSSERRQGAQIGTRSFLHSGFSVVAEIKGKKKWLPIKQGGKESTRILTHGKKERKSTKKKGGRGNFLERDRTIE